MKRILTAVLAVVVGCSTVFGLAGCNKKDDNPQTLEIFMENFGYGVDWINPIIEAFQQEDWVKEKYPDLKIPKPETLVSQGAAVNRVIAGAMSNSADLLFGTTTASGWVARSDGSRALFEELSDVYNSTVPGENIAFKEKMIPSILSWVQQDYDNVGAENYYIYPWVNGYIGMLYNRSKLNEMYGADGYTIPRTTDEFVSLADRIVDTMQADPDKYGGNDADAPFITAVGVTYTDSTVQTWWAQYETWEGYERYWLGEDERGVSSPSMLSQKGKLYAYKAYEELVGAPGQPNEAGDNLVVVKNYRGGQYLTFDKVQARYIGGKGIFMPNGDWFDIEMRNAVTAGFTYDIDFMQTPILSAVSEKLSYYDAADKAAADAAIEDGYYALTKEKRAAYDELLRKVVDCVDGKCTESQVAELYTAKGKDASKVSDDVAYVRGARSLMTQLEGHEAFIPSYATAKDVAKDFLRFMATDKAIKLFMQATDGCSTPFTFDVAEKAPELSETFTTIQTTRHAIVNKGRVLPVKTGYRLGSLGGLSMSRNPSGGLERKFMSEKARDRMSAEEMWQYDIDYYTKNDNAMWNDMLKAAGMLG